MRFSPIRAKLASKLVGREEAEAMEQVGVFDAKVHLSKLVERASRGETIMITRNGRPMAMLAPAVGAGRSRMSCDDALAILRNIRSRTSAGGDPSVKAMIDEGRRF